jgi:hypothetical protein
MEFIEPKLVRDTPPKSYVWLEEEQKKQFVINLMTAGITEGWIQEEANRMGIKLLMEGK